ncbi:MAG: hypothetical protein AB1503_10490 [Bacillota bacterium]|nr:hypothetical protein [Bacillota bacterium]
MGPPVLGCVGTAKNAGKTTALTAILHEARARGYGVALTSIGYDGEELDNLTGLPKPRVEVHPGDLVASARPCLEKSPLGWELLADCGTATALGPLVLAQVTSPGRVILAGPAYRRGLRRLCRLLAAAGPDLVLVDGAFGRLSPLAGASGVVISTGAARSRDPDVLARETGAIVQVFSLPRSPLRGRWLHHLQSESDCRQAVRYLSAGEQILVPGVVTLPALASLAGLLADARPHGGRIVFAHPVQLLLAGSPPQVMTVLGHLGSLGVGLAVGSGPAILAVTVSPYYPQPLGPGRFAAAFVDAHDLRSRVAAAAGGRVPAVDVRHDGAAELWRAVEEGLFGTQGKAEPLPGPLRPGGAAQVRGTDPGGEGGG